MLKVQTIGIIGGGQLGSMICQAAKKLNIKTVVISDDKNGPAQNFCDQFIYSNYNEIKNINFFINLVDVVTYEFENISYEVLETIKKSRPVLPNPKINQIVQNRKKEKSFINDLGIKTTEWIFIKSKQDIEINKNFLPGILKTTTLGYDGRGQFVINSLKDIKDSWCFSDDYILEKKVKLKKEISVVITRFENGKYSIYEPIENTHKDQILKNSQIPSKISQDIFEQSINSAKIIASKLKYIGTMCVEFFIDEENNLLVNEIAPRVHNSGHLTINAFNVSQFENHVRAICNLQILELVKIADAKMINILGNEIEKYRNQSFKDNEFFVDYLKKEIKDKRKMGHITILKN
jgi:5-(carboxyamino)imidazole ribonucleotide synthase|tara:strand:+ start:57 stop:1103 length:1047 start_codon:yes stop_codon:yes gene_type:complete